MSKICKDPRLKEAKERVWLAGLFGLVFTLFGGAALAVALHFIQTGALAQAWPVTDGTIIESRIATRQGRLAGALYVRDELDIRYVYKVNSQTYRNNRVYFVQDGTGAEWLASKVKRYPKGSTAPVHYNPLSPAQSVLEPGSNLKYALITSAFTLFFFVLGIGALRCFLSDWTYIRRNPS